MGAARGYQPARCALWRLGSEDRSIWSIFGSDQKNPSADSLKRMAYGYDVDFEGTGELLKVQASPHDGERGVNLNANTGFISSDTYDIEKLPPSYVSECPGDQPRE